MDDRPETGGEWMSLVNRRLSRQERRLRPANSPPVGAVFLVQENLIPPGWEPVVELAGEGPAGWVYVQEAVPVEES
jgi:hypothetical protein